MKKVSWYLFLGFACLALLLAACGGGAPPSSITLTVEDPQGNFGAAAYQVGSGDWQVLNMNGSTTKTGTFNLGTESKYGVAVRCENQTVKVIQATNSELANPKLVCSSPSTVSFTVNVSIDSGLLAGGDKVCLNDNGSNNSSCQTATASTSITTNLEPGSRDLLITLKDSSDWVKVAKVERNVNVSSGGNITVSLVPDDQLQPVSFSTPNAPAGYNGVAVVGYLRANNTASGLLILNASPTSYRPVSGFASGDLYAAMAFASATNANAQLITLQLFSSTNTFPNLSFPTPWPSQSLTVQRQTAHPRISGLNRSENDLRGYSITLQLTTGFSYTANVRKGWLGTATSYSLPDLSNKLNYTAPANGDSGTLVVTASLSNKSILESDLLANVSTLTDGDYFKVAMATQGYTVGGGQISLP